MKRKSLLFGFLVTILAVCFVINPALAGNVQRNRWEGVAIGVGAAILGSVLWDQYRHKRSSPAPARHRATYRAPTRHHRAKPAGHWEV